MFKLSPTGGFLLCVVALGAMFWPFPMVQQYFLVAHGIDKYTAVPVTVGIIAQLAYGAAIVGFLFCACSMPESPGSAGAMKPDRGRYLKRLALSGGALVTVGMAIFWFLWPPERSGADYLRMLEDRCNEELAAAVESSNSLIDKCVERKIDAM